MNNLHNCHKHVIKVATYTVEGAVEEVTCSYAADKAILNFFHFFIIVRFHCIARKCQ